MSGFAKWFAKRSPLPEMWREHMAEYYAPKNFNIFYYAGSLLLLMLVFQFVSGFLVLVHYVPTAAGAYDSVFGIMYDVDYGWLIQYAHVDGVSLIFVLLYLHMARGMLYGSYRAPRELVWIIGYTIYLAFMAEAFFGYVLPYSNLSYWAGTVITSLFKSIPWIGGWVTTIVRGGSGISGDTLGRFMALHVTVVFLVIVALVVFHILYLHKVGSNNPDGIEIKEDKGPDGHPIDGIPFHPYYSVKDLFGFGVWLFIFAAIIFYNPTFFHVFLERTMSTPANALKSLPDVTPPWYLSPFYAMLRSIPNKNGGIILMVAAVVFPFILPWLDRNPVKSTRFRLITRIMLLVFFANFIMLAYLGEQPPLPQFFLPERLGAAIYIGFFVLLPFVSKVEPTRTPPKRVHYHAH